MRPRDPARALYDLKCEIAYRVGVDRECVEVRTVWWRWLAANGTETMDLTAKATLALARIRGRVEAYRNKPLDADGR